MPMHTCRACGKHYTDRVNKCPECGEPVPSQFWEKTKKLLQTIALIIALYAAWRYLSSAGYLQKFF